jgi:hypothetical protein
MDTVPIILGLFEGADFDPCRWTLLEPIEMGQNCQPSTKKRFGHCIYNMAMGYLALHLSWAALNWKSMFLFQFSSFIFIFVHKNIIIGSLPKWILLGFSFGFMACILFIGHETK